MIDIARLFVSKRIAFILIVFLIAFIGYGFFFCDFLLLDDDIAGRFKAIKNDEFLKSQTAIIKQWTMGRPIGHISNVTIQGIFLPFPEYVVTFFAILAIVMQSVFLRSILKKLGLPNPEANLLAIIFLITPISVSLFLPVHSFATEWSTWFMLISIYAMLCGKPIWAGLVLSLQFATYETYATIFWLPVAFLFLQSYVFNNEGEVKRETILAAAKSSALFTLAFFVGVALLFYIRTTMPSSGREAGIADLGLITMGLRMLEAGLIGFKTNLSFHFEAISWAYTNGPSYAVWLMISLPIAIFILLSSTNAMNNVKENRLSSIELFLVLSLALLLIFSSYMIYFEQRFPPNIKTSRLANIHSGSRFGLIFLFLFILNLVKCVPYKTTHLMHGVIAIIVGFGVTFHHSYGYQQSLSSDKKAAIVEALEYACRRSSEKDIIALVMPAKISQYKSDIVLAWTSPYIAPTTFNKFENKVVFVTYNRAQEFTELLELKENRLSKNDLEDIVHFSFVNLKWLYPYGDLGRWDIDNQDIVALSVNYKDFKEYEFYFLGKESPINAERNCNRRQ